MRMRWTEHNDFFSNGTTVIYSGRPLQHIVEYMWKTCIWQISWNVTLQTY